MSTDPDSLPLNEDAGDGSTGRTVLSSGVVTRLHDELYTRLRHGRLVLIGGPGAGKTGAMMLLLAAQLGLIGVVVIGPVFGLVGALRDGACANLLCTELACLLRGRPVRFIRLLEDARERQILRQAGAVYQFRHADLQDRLANQYRDGLERA